MERRNSKYSNCILLYLGFQTENTFVCQWYRIYDKLANLTLSNVSFKQTGNIVCHLYFQWHLDWTMAYSVLFNGIFSPIFEKRTDHSWEVFLFLCNNFRNMFVWDCGGLKLLFRTSCFYCAKIMYLWICYLASKKSPKLIHEWYLTFKGSPQFTLFWHISSFSEVSEPAKEQDNVWLYI